MKKGIIVLLGFLFLVSVGLGIYGYLVSNSSKFIFSRSIESTDKKLLSLTDEFLETVVPNKTIQSGNFALDTTSTLAYEKLSLKSNMNIYMDKNNNSAYLKTKVILGKTNLVINALFKDKKLYYKIEDVHNNFYYTDYDVSLDMDKNKDYEKKLVKYLEESIKENINDNSFKQTKETIKLGNKNYNTKKVTLVVTEKLVDVIEINFYKKIENDEELIKYIASINNTSVKKMKEKIDKEIEKLSKKTSNKNVFNYSIYVSGPKTLKHEVKVEDDIITVEDYTDKGKYIINVEGKEKKDTIMTMKYINNKGNMTINYVNDDYKVNVNAETKNNYIDSNAEIISDKKTVGKINYKCDKDSIVLKGNLDSIKIDINGKIKNEKMPTIDVSKAKSYEETTEKEQQKLISKILVIE